MLSQSIPNSIKKCSSSGRTFRYITSVFGSLVRPQLPPVSPRGLHNSYCVTYQIFGKMSDSTARTYTINAGGTATATAQHRLWGTELTGLVVPYLYPSPPHHPPRSSFPSVIVCVILNFPVESEIVRWMLCLKPTM